MNLFLDHKLSVHKFSHVLHVRCIGLTISIKELRVFIHTNMCKEGWELYAVVTVETHGAFA